MTGACYVLHFTRPFHGANGRHIGARYYVGIALDGDVQRRLAEHLAGHGSPLVRAVVQAGIGVEVVLSVPGDRALERRWHVRHGSRLCPRCRPLRAAAGQQLRLFRFRQSKQGAVHAAAPTPRRLAA
jgi:hypothetical protein